MLLVTIDTLRADRVGAYGLASARTPVIDGLARDGVRLAHAYAPAPITLPSHASLLSGRYPPGHGSRHNGLAMSASVPTLATTLDQAGFATAAFVSAFPLDRRFGLARGFDVYDDELPRATDGRPQNERSGAETVDRARRWLAAHTGDRFFLWVHLFEPHAPYGPGADGRSALARYDDEVATADSLTGRLIDALGDRQAATLLVVTADHGEAFGEHGEIGHSVFVYDTTLRVPWVMRGPGLQAGLVSEAGVSLVDLAPTVVSLVGAPAMDTDGISLVPLLNGGTAPERVIYAESFAPLFDFGWASLRSVREGAWKYIAAPKPELYETGADPGESRNQVSGDPQRATRMNVRVDRFGPAEPERGAAVDADTMARLRALGYFGGAPGRASGSARPDPKDRIALASRLATVMAGEVQGAELITTLEAIVRDDPANPQARLRLGYAYLAQKACHKAEPHLARAVALEVPSADPGLGLAQCRGQAGDLAGAAAALDAADKAEPRNPVVMANRGLLALQQGDAPGGIDRLRQALTLDPGLLEARFNLARALARNGRRLEARTEADELLKRLPPTAPQRAEVQRLIEALK